MADITMCEGQTCEKKETCYRFKAPVNEYRQAYFVGLPIHVDGQCPVYWPMEEQNGS